MNTCEKKLCKVVRQSVRKAESAKPPETWQFNYLIFLRMDLCVGDDQFSDQKGVRDDVKCQEAQK